MTDPNEGYICWRLKNGQYCDDCMENRTCTAYNDDLLNITKDTINYGETIYRRKS